MPGHVEIERKYLLRAMPTLPEPIAVWHIEQGYLPDGSRIRRACDQHGQVVLTHTLKTGSGLSRQEIEAEISEEQFDSLWQQTRGRQLTKTRSCISQDSLVWEIDQFEGIDLVLAEVELPREDTAIEIPDWLRDFVVREVTDEPAFTNAELALRMLVQRRTRSQRP